METCKGPECTRPVLNKKHGLCSAHIQQFYKGKDLTPLFQHHVQKNKECDFEGCNKKRHSRQWCQGHYTQWRKGRELKPLQSGGTNKYPDDAVCKHEGCTRNPTAHYYCSAHYWQMKQYGITWNVGEPNPMTLNDGYSTDRFCTKCKRTVNWRAFYLEQKMCRECYKVHISREYDVLPEVGKGRKKSSEANMADLLDYINKQVSNALQEDAVESR